MSKVTFIENEHLYLNENGIIIPSVTQLVDYQFPSGYDNVPTNILNNKARYGTTVHHMIEGYEAREYNLETLSFSRLDPNVKSAVVQYDKIKQKYPDVFNIDKMEQVVSYQDRYAGMFDLLNKNGMLIDIKTTASLHREWVRLQLGLYYTALYDMGWIKELKDIGYVLWIPKASPAELVEIDVLKPEECLEVLERYEKEHSAD